MSGFENKTIWITGASSGIGKALAIKFSSLGANIVLSSRNEDELLKNILRIRYNVAQVVLVQ